MTEKLSKAARVHALMNELLYTHNELNAVNHGVMTDPVILPEGAVLVEGTLRKFGFHPGRLAKNAEKIIGLVREIVDDKFMRSEGGGYTFLNLPVDRNGEQWGEQPTAESLYCLAAALGLAGFCMPREFWSSLPGGVPYIWFDLEMKSTQPTA